MTKYLLKNFRMAIFISHMCAGLASALLFMVAFGVIEKTLLAIFDTLIVITGLVISGFIYEDVEKYFSLKIQQEENQNQEKGEF